MHLQKIISLTQTLKQKPLIQSPQQIYLAYSPQQLRQRLKEVEQSHDEVLLSALALAELAEDLNFDKSQEYEVVVEELERERVQRREDVRELRENVEITGEKLDELKGFINEKEIQNAGLRTEIEQRDIRIFQFEIETKQAFAKLESQYSSRLMEQAREHELAISKVIGQYEMKIKQLQEEGKHFLDENLLLASRLEQMMRYVGQVKGMEVRDEGSKTEREAEDADELPARILQSCNRSLSSPIPSSHSLHSSSPTQTDPLLHDEQTSQQTSSPQRLILHEILNTQDRKSINFGDSFQASYLQGRDENTNTMNWMGASKGSKGSKSKTVGLGVQRVNIIQEFRPEEGVGCQKLGSQNLNPYFVFFTLIGQCAKIDSGNLEKAAGLDLSGQWDSFLEQKVPLHEWYSHLKSTITQKISLS